jgi:hypothetical protein
MEARTLLASITEYPIPGGTAMLGNGPFRITGEAAFYKNGLDGIQRLITALI